MKREKVYIRDSRSPKPRSEAVSRSMSANRAKNTKPEIELQRLLKAYRIKGSTLHLRDLAGRPDIAFPKEKLAVFLHGCFWHRCPYCKLPLPQSNRLFWKEKFNRNLARDKRKTEQLKRLGWKVLIVRECRLKKDPETQLERIATKLAA